ncbi:hypothetical protein GQ42DRAFT_156743 [Ramicandelaber brevisporus]|nr:hypothetical protein GQ42DRAFT_156743 [Ramicandelaber brevisporus]
MDDDDFDFDLGGLSDFDDTQNASIWAAVDEAEKEFQQQPQLQQQQQQQRQQQRHPPQQQQQQPSYQQQEQQLPFWLTSHFNNSDTEQCELDNSENTGSTCSEAIAIETDTSSSLTYGYSWTILDFIQQFIKCAFVNTSNKTN